MDINSRYGSPSAPPMETGAEISQQLADLQKLLLTRGLSKNDIAEIEVQITTLTVQQEKVNQVFENCYSQQTPVPLPVVILTPGTFNHVQATQTYTPEQLTLVNESTEKSKYIVHLRGELSTALKQQNELLTLTQGRMTQQQSELYNTLKQRVDQFQALLAQATANTNEAYIPTGHTLYQPAIVNPAPQPVVFTQAQTATPPLAYTQSRALFDQMLYTRPGNPITTGPVLTSQPQPLPYQQTLPTPQYNQYVQQSYAVPHAQYSAVPPPQSVPLPYTSAPVGYTPPYPTASYQSPLPPAQHINTPYYPAQSQPQSPLPLPCQVTLPLVNNQPQSYPQGYPQGYGQGYRY